MSNRLSAVFFAAALLVGLGAGCSGTDTGPDGVSDQHGQPRTAGLALTSDNLGNTDVSGMRFTVRSCTGGVVDTATKAFEDMYLPGGISALEREPYDEDSQHIFADHYFLLAAGCYDVIAQPLRSLRPERISRDCDAARKDNVRVEDGETTEILLISQCKGPEKGGLDVIGSINHPPEILNLEYPTSKFITSCQRRRDVCVTVRDVDGDPLELVWSATDAGTHKATITQVSRTRLNATDVEVCGKIATAPKGQYAFRLQAYDQAYDGGGTLTRIEDLLQGNLHGQCQADNTTCSSNDEINSWVYAGQACQARSAVMVMAMNNSPGPSDQGYSRPFIRQTADWANHLVRTKQQPRILYVLDDNHNGEHGVNGLFDGPDGDARWVIDALRAEFGAGQVTMMDEPAFGLRLRSLFETDGTLKYDMVWFANPGWPVDDIRSRTVLKKFRDEGGSLILQGNDITGNGGGGPNMEELTFMRLIKPDTALDNSNGSRTCGALTDNNAGANYSVSFTVEPVGALDGAIMDLRGLNFSYGNDIDHTVRLAQGERVLARASFQNARCPQGVSFPAAVAIDPADL